MIIYLDHFVQDHFGHAHLLVIGVLILQLLLLLLEVPLDKLLAVDALGVVMIKHGEEFGDDSAYGRSLVSLGRAHCSIASLQESFAATLDETYISAVRQSEDEIKEYQVQRRKLESRRCVMMR